MSPITKTYFASYSDENRSKNTTTKLKGSKQIPHPSRPTYFITIPNYLLILSSFRNATSHLCRSPTVIMFENLGPTNVIFTV